MGVVAHKQRHLIRPLVLEVHPTLVRIIPQLVILAEVVRRDTITSDQVTATD